MRREPAWLLEHAANTYSQTGEDGIIEAILRLLPERDKWCVEFGAWDGVFLSNTRRLIEDAEYKAVLIEGDEACFSRLRSNNESNDRVITLNAFVGCEGSTRLDALLEPLQIPKDFDYLSVDVDGMDFHIWKSLDIYRPKVVCIEFNPTIATEARFVQRADSSVNHGCSLASLVELGKAKGYELVCVLPFNAFFVDSRYFSLFAIDDNSALSLRKDLSTITHFFIGYDGSIHLQGNAGLPWHGISIHESDFQVLPRALRKYPGRYNWLERQMLRGFRLFRSPPLLLDALKRRISRR
jgi:hypothetical protein